MSNRLQRISCILRARLRSLGGESGQAVILAAVGMAVILSFLGLAIDVGHLRYVKRNMQLASDAAAMAAALEIQYCQGVLNCPAMQAAAQDALVENGFAGSTVVANCAAIPVSGLTLEINNPACAAGASDPNRGKGGYVEVELSMKQPTYFARLAGWNNVPMMVRSEAARSGGSYCMYALDPTGSGAITVALLSAINSSCGIMDESNSPSALACGFFAGITASQISVVGGVAQFLCFLSPTPQTHIPVPTPADPLAYLAKPSVPACGTSTASPYHGASSLVTVNGGANVTLYPDFAYCGGIRINPGATVSFQPGVFVTTSSKGPGGLTVDAGTTTTGNGVMFYNYGPAGGITFNFSGFTAGGVSLIAPTSGTYSGMLFFQDPGNTNAAQIVGSPAWNTTLEGTYYFPTARVGFAFSGPVNYNILVAKDIDFEIFTFAGGTLNSSGFSSNYSSLANGAPTAGSGAVLVQ